MVEGSTLKWAASCWHDIHTDERRYRHSGDVQGDRHKRTKSGSSHREYKTSSHRHPGQHPPRQPQQPRPPRVPPHPRPCSTVRECSTVYLQYAASSPQKAIAGTNPSEPVIDLNLTNRAACHRSRFPFYHAGALPRHRCFGFDITIAQAKGTGLTPGFTDH